MLRSAADEAVNVEQDIIQQRCGRKRRSSLQHPQ